MFQVEIPQILLKNEEEKRRFEEAKKRKENRTQIRKAHKHGQQPCIVRPSILE